MGRSAFQRTRRSIASEIYAAGLIPPSQGSRQAEYRVNAWARITMPIHRQGYLATRDPAADPCTDTGSGVDWFWRTDGMVTLLAFYGDGSGIPLTNRRFRH